MKKAKRRNSAQISLGEQLAHNGTTPDKILNSRLEHSSRGYAKRLRLIWSLLNCCNKQKRRSQSEMQRIAASTFAGSVDTSVFPTWNSLRER